MQELIHARLPRLLPLLIDKLVPTLVDLGFGDPPYRGCDPCLQAGLWELKLQITNRRSQIESVY